MKRGTDPGPGDPHSHALAPEEIIRVKVKAELRKRMRGVRKTAPLEACQERSAKIVKTLCDLEEVKRAKSVALFWPIEARHEVDLRALDRVLRDRGAKVAYPAIDAETDEMTFRFVADVTKMEELGYGFAEPPPDAPRADELDVVIVPAIAVDPTGHRIGYGAGYYDRTLPKYAPPAASIAVIYDWQLVAEVPFTPTDVRVGKIVTDTRVLDALP
jgi:5-formyltetrahydrofolate cyclo-ligase